MDKYYNYQFDLINGISLRVEAISFAQAIGFVIEKFDFDIMPLVKSIHCIEFSLKFN